MNNLSKLLNKCVSAKSKEEAAADALYLALCEYIDFEFFITYQTSDQTYMVACDKVSSRATGNATVGSCISVIQEKGTLSMSDYYKLTI